MRKFLVTTFVTAFVVSSAGFAIAQGLPGQPEFSGVLTTTVNVTNSTNSALGSNTESELHVGSIVSGTTVGNLDSTANATSLTSSSDGLNTESNITIGSIGE